MVNVKGAARSAYLGRVDKHEDGVWLVSHAWKAGALGSAPFSRVLLSSGAEGSTCNAGPRPYVCSLFLLRIALAWYRALH